ncbi:MAG: UDP-N-acetylmuramoyl-tripeptide--D-alanyl-D-alanine ligase [Chitinophagales bacterium]
MTVEQLYEYFQKSKSVSIDSRSVKKGDLFIGLEGANHDGNAFAADAIENGAKYVIIDNQDYKKKGSRKFLVVENSLETLQDIAKHHAARLKIPIVGVTGSNGKTTTTALIAAVLSKKFNTYSTPHNYNNHIGVPLSVLGINDKHEMAVIELAANHQGEIAALSKIAQPTHGLITNIGRAHMQGFGGKIKNVMHTKGELFDFIEEVEGHCFVNCDDKFVAKVGYYMQDVSTYGTNRWFDTYARVSSSDPYLNVRWFPKNEQVEEEDLETEREVNIEYYDIQTKLMGKHHVYTILSAIRVGVHFGVEKADIVAAIEAFEPVNNRSEVLMQGSNTILLDAYNANPDSMEAALGVLGSASADVKVAILGDMLELGKTSGKEHQAIYDKAMDMGLNHIVLVGEEFKKVANTRKKAVEHFDTAAEAKAWLAEQGLENAFVLVKGSRSIALEGVVA